MCESTIYILDLLHNVKKTLGVVSKNSPEFTFKAPKMQTTKLMSAKFKKNVFKQCLRWFISRIQRLEANSVDLNKALVIHGPS